MTPKMRATLPLALACGVVVFVYLEFATNFTFHWTAGGSLGNGLDLPGRFYLVPPAAFVSWGMFFVLGADNSAARTVAINSVVGAAAALILFALVALIKHAPDFWAIAVVTGVIAVVVIVASAELTWLNVPVVFTAFAACVFWWVATGFDGWVTNGGGIGHSVAGLAKPATAGTGAFAGVLSTPYPWVAINTCVTLLIGCLCGLLTVRLGSALSFTGGTPSDAIDAPDGVVDDMHEPIPESVVD